MRNVNGRGWTGDCRVEELGCGKGGEGEDGGWDVLARRKEGPNPIEMA